MKWHIGQWCLLRLLDQYRRLVFLPTLGSCGYPSYHNPTGLFQGEPAEESILPAISIRKLIWVARIPYNYPINFINLSFV
jgi:hypothetical protein